MEENNKIDKLFSKGIEGFSVTPSSDIKKKVFASPTAITPLKPWYMGAKGLLLAGSIIPVSVILIYFGINYNDNNKNTANYNNTTKNFNDSKNTNIINPDDQQVTQNKNTKDLNVNSNSENIASNITIKKEIAGHARHDENTSSERNVVQGIIEDVSASNSLTQIQESANNKVPNVSDQPANNNSLTELNSNEIINREKPVVELTHKSESENNAKYNRHSELVSASPQNTIRHAELVSASPLFVMNKLLPYISPEQLAEYMNLCSEKPAHYKKGLWYVEANSGMFLTNFKVTANNDEYKLAKNAKQEMLKPSMGCEMGINAVYQQKRFIYKAGLSYVNYGEKLSGKIFLNNPYNTTSINYNGGYYEAIINGNYYDIDSISYFHYTYTQTDHIFVNDSTLAWNTQNRPVDVLDTINLTKYDTVPKTILYNNISYVQMPLSVGYSFPFGRFGCAILATVTPGYFVKVNGSQMNITNYPAIEPYSKNTIKKFALSAGIGLEFNYHLNETLIIGIEPFYRKSLLGMYNKEYKLNQNANSYGFRFSIKKLL